MIKYILLFLVIFIWFVIAYSKNQRVFNKDVYRVYKGIQDELKYSGVRGDQYDNAKDYLRSQNLKDSDLEKLQILISIKNSNNNLNAQIGTVLATVALTITTLSFGTIFAAVLSGLYSKFAEISIESPNNRMTDILFDAMDSIVYFVGIDFSILAWLFIGGIGIWRRCVTDINQTNNILIKIVTDLIQERKNNNSMSST